MGRCVIATVLENDSEGINISNALLFALAFGTMFGQLGTMMGASAGVAGAIFHIFVYLTGGRKGLTQIGGLWSLVLEVLGIRQLHEMTTGRAVLALVIMLVVLVVVLTVLLAEVIAAFVFGLGGQGRGY